LVIPLETTLVHIDMRLPFTNIKVPIGPLIAPIASLVPNAAVVPILSGPARGILWQVGSGMVNFWLGTYEREKIAQFAAQLRSHMVVYDVGANVGAYAVLAARRCAAVHAFEPDLGNLSRLRRNIALNRFTNCTIVPAAAGSHDGIANFAAGKDAFVGRLDPGGSIVVRCVSLDSYAADHGAPDLIKMDIEGGEWESLLATPDELLASIPQLAMEMHGFDDPKILEVLRKLNRNFYIVNLHFNNWSCTSRATPLPAWAYQVLWVNKRIGIVDPTAPVPAPMSPLNAPDSPTWPDCQLRAPRSRP